MTMREKSRGRLRLASVTGFGESFMIDERIDICVSPVNGAHAGRHLVEDDAEREDVRALIDRLPFRLLRRHVGDGADDPPVAGERARGHAGLGDQAGIFLQLCQPEVEHLHAAVAGDHHVGRLRDRGA